MGYTATYDTIVVGGGHSGAEAAHACALMGSKTLLLTISLDSIGLMPCNPSIGGPAKSHLVFEVDALGGLMGKLADQTSIQKKILNRSKGPAVYALRAQVNRRLYAHEMLKTLEETKGLDIFQGEVSEILTQEGKLAGVRLATGLSFRCSSLILATGTYLSSRVIIGDYVRESGPQELSNSRYLAGSLHALGIPTRPFKTGTPPRLHRGSLRLAELEVQPGDAAEYAFSFRGEVGELPQVDCFLAYTGKETEEVIRENLHLSPLFSGVIQGVGPRYCPSIEDKIQRFPEKSSHHLFLEPEGHDTEEIYLQGFSTSLPAEVQLQMVRSIPGLEEAKILKLGYAIEYEVIDAMELQPTLESKKLENLYFAGQILGTSGYEEAAALGIMAGINASLKQQGKEPFILDRSEGYIGVLIDDLITKGTQEPYRMFTSRAEYRLLLRQSNADRRLLPYGYALGLISKEEYEEHLEKMARIDGEVRRLEGLRISPQDPGLGALLEQAGSAPLEQGIRGNALLKRPEISYEALADLYPPEVPLHPREGEEVALMIKYAGYIRKQEEQVASFQKGEKKQIPPWLTDFREVRGLTLEAVEKLNRVQPRSVGQARRISGITPADIQVLLIYLESLRRKEGPHE